MSNQDYSFTKKRLRTKEDIYPTTNVIKSLYINFPLHVIYNLVNNYLLSDSVFIDNSTNYSEIAFAFDKDWVQANYVKFEPFKDFLRLNKINLLMYDINSTDSMSIFAGYENLIIGDYLKSAKTLDIIAINNISLAVKYLSDFSCRIYYVVPDLIFKHNIENNEDSSNYADNYVAVISHYIFYDQMMQFLKKTEKYPLYRIVLPLYYNKVDNLLINYRAESPLLHEILNIQRSTFESNELSKAFLQIHKHNKAKNYSIYDEKAMFTRRQFKTLSAKSDGYVLCKDSELAYENLTKERHYELFKELSRETEFYDNGLVLTAEKNK